MIGNGYIDNTFETENLIKNHYSLLTLLVSLAKYKPYEEAEQLFFPLYQWFPNWGTRSPSGLRRDFGGPQEAPEACISLSHIHRRL